MRVDTLERPLLVVPAIPKDGGMKFILPKYVYSLDEEIAPKAWAILELCNGVNTVDMIIEQLKDQDSTFITGFLNDLNSLGFVIDSRKFYMFFHAISKNPMVYSSDMTSDEIAEHANSARLQVKEGKTFKFHRNIKSKLFHLQELRKSCRSYSNELLSIDEIGGILDIGYSYSRHAVPSAGGLYPMKIYVVALEDQKDFPAGYYEYDNEKNCLVLFNKTPDDQRILYALNDTQMPFGAPVVLIIVADANRQPNKYSNKGYRFMAIEAGEIAQNISLSAVEAGLSTCELGGLLEDVISKELGLEECLPFLAIVIGKESEREQENVWLKADKFERNYIGSGKSVQDVWLLDDALADNFSKSYFQFLAMTENHQITSGISTSWADAKLKAIVEAHERQCAANVRWDVISKATILGGSWLDPRIIAPLDDDQYKNLEYLQKFNEDIEIEWVKGVDYAGKSIFVPIDFVFYPINNIGRKLIVDTYSSGFAAYTDYEGAVNRGLLELIERDSLMRNWYEKVSPEILSYSILPTHLKNRVDFWKDSGREVVVLNMSQNGVIVIEVIIKSDNYPCFVSGASGSLDNFANTTIKAFQEAESRLIYGLNEGCGRTIKPNDIRNILDHELLYAQSKEFHEHIRFLCEGKVTTDIPTSSTSFAELQRNMEAIIVDVSGDDLLLSVVKVLSPKLIPINFGYGTEHHKHHTLCRRYNTSLGFPHYFA
jgi:ribosomal protein S12 methylthiotransferase accessory factor